MDPKDPANAPPQPPPEPLAGACWLDQHRLCGPDCAAFLTKPPDGVAYQGEGWARCLLLVNADRVGRHLVIITQITDRLERQRRTEVADQKRPSPSVPEVK